ncbi:related to Alpha-1,2-mannosyltransferase MNN2 [Saccharomycodes ludwigii]|uniref:Related to Alpha-1,2-mannosyltransferase MNN2 n=1 Tax=Saccharomycodes ludwigii TaxID=36035 RepID=A0A376B7X2_9ASCO|nr:related to Alpha-1,2-mannosyltransferase MNN2 [Saccharomycodes ludwigii]
MLLLRPFYRRTFKKLVIFGLIISIVFFIVNAVLNNFTIQNDNSTGVNVQNSNNNLMLGFDLNDILNFNPIDYISNNYYKTDDKGKNEPLAYQQTLSDYVSNYRNKLLDDEEEDSLLKNNDENGAAASHLRIAPEELQHVPLDNSVKLAADIATDSTKGDKGTGEQNLLDTETRTKLLHDFYRKIFESITKYSPAGKLDRKYHDNCPLRGDVGYDNFENWETLSYDSLRNCLIIPEETLNDLKEKHAAFVNSISGVVLGKQAYQGNGIVTVGGGKFSLLAYTLIETLRNTGTTLPVEVLIPHSDEGDDDFCQYIESNLNAKCIYFRDFLPQDIIDSFEFKGYQFKSLAISASSFANLLLLDADNLPLKSLDDIFDKEPYKSTGLVVWPDFWRRSTTPLYYDIADIDINLNKRVRNCIDDITPPWVYQDTGSDNKDVPLHDLEGTIPDPSTESGQLMINKVDQLATTLLSLYYNVNGPSWYYPIFTQKSQGEGDKETFLAAANYYKYPFYQVKSMIKVDGFHAPDESGFRGVAMLQYDMVQDYARYKLAQESILKKYGATAVSTEMKPDPNYKGHIQSFYEEYFDVAGKPNIDVLFVHSNHPKFDPLLLSEQQDLIYSGKHVRTYRRTEILQKHDLELEIYRNYAKILCGDPPKDSDNKYGILLKFKYLEPVVNTEKYDKMCTYIKDRLKYLQESHIDAIKGNL